VAEAYYNVSLADCCAIIANVQWILSGPNQVSGRAQSRRGGARPPRLILF